MTARPSAPAAARNRSPILHVLRREFRDCTSVLEIGSGTGEHAVYVGRELSHLTWQTSDLVESHAGINAWLDGAGLPNVLAPLDLDLETSPAPDGEYDAIFSSNTAHIMSIGAVEKMFRIAGDTLTGGGRFCLYGPFREHGEFSTESNAAFDASLRAQDPAMGVRDLEELQSFAEQNGMSRRRQYAMPANNLIVVWEKNR